MRTMSFLCLLLTSASFAQRLPTDSAPPLTAGEIMARVAENQDRSEALRKQYIYKQHVHIISHKPGGRLREESADYDVVPMPDKTEKQLKQLTGRYWHKGKYEEF